MVADPPRDDRMRVLCVISSSNQLYSGIGRALFELSRRLKERVAYEFAIDDGNERNVDLLIRFGREHGFPVHVGPHVRPGETLDAGNTEIERLLNRGDWNAVECVCFANAATNLAVLNAIANRVLIYTPHDQPLWTIPMSPGQADQTRAAHDRMVRRADLVLCDSPAEMMTLRARVSNPLGCVHLPLGCDFETYRPGVIPRREQLLFVGDLAEPRKRFDRVLAAFETLLAGRPTLRLVVIGNRSREAIHRVPPRVRNAVTLLGYVSEEELRRHYAESLAFVLLSDFEAFGIPILEALASGTTVFLAEQAETRSLFGSHPGAHFCPADDPRATVALMRDVLGRGVHTIEEASRDYPRLRARFDWDQLARRKWSMIAAAWSRRHGFALSA